MVCINADQAAKYTKFQTYYMMATFQGHASATPWSLLRAEVWRLHTFRNYPQKSPKYAILLAANGFSYVGSGGDDDDSVICYFCAFRHRGWQSRDEVGAIHARFSSDCPMVTGLDCDNVPLAQRQSGTDLQFSSLLSQEGHSIRPTEQAAACRDSTEEINFVITTPLDSGPRSLPSDGIEQSPPSLDVLESAVTAVPSEGQRSQPPAQSVTFHTGACVAVSSACESQQNPPLEGGKRGNEAGAQYIAKNDADSSSMASDSDSDDDTSSDAEAPLVLSDNHEGEKDDLRTERDEKRLKALLGATCGSSGRKLVHGPEEQESRVFPPPNPGELMIHSRGSSTSDHGPYQLGVVTQRHRNTGYETYHARLTSFSQWQGNCPVRKEDLAKAGFYFVRRKGQDCTSCFCCGVVLGNWEEGDDPRVEHARWAPGCTFLLQRMGPDFVEVVQGLHSKRDRDSDQSQITWDEVCQQNSEFRTQDKYQALRTDPAVIAVKSVLHEDFSEDLVLEVAMTMKAEGIELSSPRLLSRVVCPEMSTEECSAESSPSAEPAVDNLANTNRELRTQLMCTVCKREEKEVVLLP